MSEAARPPRPFADPLWVLAALGLATGVGELLFLAARKYGRGLFVFQPPEVIWSTPAVEALLFVTLGGVGLLLSRALGRPFRQGVGLGLGAGLGTLSGLLLFPPIHPLASLLVAVGVGLQIARQRWSDKPALARVARRVVLAAAPVLGVLALAVHLPPALRERKAVATLPDARTGAPNVLLIILDTVRALNLSVYGYSRPTTPHLAARAATGARFVQAVSPAPWTLPSHASIFTGRHAHELPTDWYVPLDTRDPTLAEVFAQAGYRTAGFVANLPYTNRETGLARGFQHYEDWPLSGRQLLLSSALVRAVTTSDRLRRLIGYHDLIVRKRAPDLNADLLRWVQRDSTRPFFAFLNYYDAHTPFVPPEPYRSRFAPPGEPSYADLDRRTANVPWDPDLIRGAMNAYDGSIAYLDDYLDRLFVELERRRLLANTLVIVTSDHGEEFAEHGLFSHGNSVYLPSVEVPLLLWLPGVVPAGAVLEPAVSLTDLPATIADLTGVDHRFPGESLRRFWSDPGADPERPIYTEVRHAPKLPAWYPSTVGDLLAVIDRELRLIRNGDGRLELYDIGADPLEQHDLIADPSRAEAVHRLGGLLEAARRLRPEPSRASQ